MKLKELPPHVRKVALKRANDWHNINGAYSRYRLLQLHLSEAFVWHNTEEGSDIWNAVDDGNYTPFNNFHKIKTNE